MRKQLMTRLFHPMINAFLPPHVRLPCQTFFNRSFLSSFSSILFIKTFKLLSSFSSIVSVLSLRFSNLFSSHTNRQTIFVHFSYPSFCPSFTAAVRVTMFCVSETIDLFLLKKKHRLVVYRKHLASVLKNLQHQQLSAEERERMSNK